MPALKPRCNFSPFESVSSIKVVEVEEATWIHFVKISGMRSEPW